MEKQFIYDGDIRAKGRWEAWIDIPEKLESLSVCLDAGGDRELPPGYFYMKDGDGRVRFQKMTWGKEIHLRIDGKAERTTPGCVPGAVMPGRWSCELYVPGEEEYSFHMLCTGNEREDWKNLECMEGECWSSGRAEGSLMLDAFCPKRKYGEKPGWYKGDFHTHTCISDGHETIKSAMVKAKDMGMDFYVPTEHNILPTGWSTSEGPMILPGMEATTEEGHCNLFGLDRIPDTLWKLLENMEGSQADAVMRELGREAAARNWLVSINHPFLHIWKWKHGNFPLEHVDFLEIVNDPTYQYARESNDKAIRFLEFLWQDGHRIYGIGGSDSHNLLDEWYPGAEGPSVAGDPGTYVFMERLSPDELLWGMRRGRMYVSRFCRLDIAIKGEEREYLPGDEILAGEKLCYSCRIEGLVRKPYVWFCKNGERYLLEPAAETDGSYNVSVDMIFQRDEYSWAYLEIRDSSGDFLAWVNPVYGGSRNPQYRTWQEALTAFEKVEKENKNMEKPLQFEENLI